MRSRAGRLLVSAALLPAAATAAAGCGSQEGFPPAAEPTASPVPDAEPAGKVIDLGPGEAEGVAADPVTGAVAVGTRDPDRLFLVSEAESASPEIRRVEIPESPRHMQLAGPGGPLLTTAEQADQLIEVALRSGKTTLTKVGDYPHDAAATAGGEIFVGNEGGDTISVVAGGESTEELPAPEQPGGIAASGDVVAVVAVAERVIALYDAGTHELTGQVEAGVGPTHVLAGDDGRFYVADTEGDALLIFDSGEDGEPEGKPRLIDRIGVTDSPYGIAIDNRADRLWVTRTGANLVTEYQLGELAPRRLRSFDTVQQPNSVAVDPATGLVYVAGRTDGVLQVIDPATDREAR